MRIFPSRENSIPSVSVPPEKALAIDQFLDIKSYDSRRRRPNSLLFRIFLGWRARRSRFVGSEQPLPAGVQLEELRIGSDVDPTHCPEAPCINHRSIGRVLVGRYQIASVACEANPTRLDALEVDLLENIQRLQIDNGYAAFFVAYVCYIFRDPGRSREPCDTKNPCEN